MNGISGRARHPHASIIPDREHASRDGNSGSEMLTCKRNETDVGAETARVPGTRRDLPSNAQPGDWYVDQPSVEKSNGRIIESGCVSGAHTPAEAVDRGFADTRKNQSVVSMHSASGAHTGGTVSCGSR